MWISLIHSAAAAASAHKLRLMSPIVEPLIVNPHTTIATPQPKSCIANCSGHGRCDEIGSCVCFDGYTGTACEIQPPDACSEKGSCNGHGWCMRGKCLCEEFWRGPACETPAACPNDCSGFGQCVRGKYCRCDPMHTGADCSRPKPNCPTSGLLLRACGGLEHGVCDSESGSCVCRKEWRGAACETSTMPRPCPSGLVSRDSSHPYSVIMLDASGSSENGIANQSSSSSSSSSATTNRTRFATCSNRGRCDHETGRCVCDQQWEGMACERPLGARTPLEWVGLVVTILFVLALIALMTMLFYCSYVRGVKPSDAMRGRWNVRTEEGWKPAEAVGGLPGARYERYGFWVA